MSYERRKSSVHALPPTSAPATAFTDHKPSVKTNTLVARPAATTFSISLRFEQPTSNAPIFGSGNSNNVEHPYDVAIPSVNMI